MIRKWHFFKANLSSITDEQQADQNIWAMFLSNSAHLQQPWSKIHGKKKQPGWRQNASLN